MKTAIKITGIFSMVVISAFLETGCGGSSSSATGPADSTQNTHGVSIDACGFLTQAEAATLMGLAIDTMIHTTSNYTNSCLYEAPPVDSLSYLPARTFSITAFTTVGIQTINPTTSVPIYFAGLKTTNGITFVQLSGIGDDAIWQTKPGTLSFYKGDVAVDVMFHTQGFALDTSAAAKAGATSVATAVAAKI